MKHVALVSVESEGTRLYASCLYCDWITEPFESERGARLQAREHSDQEALQRLLEDMRLTYPDMTMDEMLGLD